MRRQVLAASSASLKAGPRKVAREVQFLVRVVRWRMVAKVDSDRVGCTQVYLVLGREVIEGQQGVAILRQRRGGLGVLGLVAGEEVLEGTPCFRPTGRHPDRLQVALGLAQKALGQRRKYIAHRAEPALMHRVRVDMLQRGPESQGAVTDGQPGTHGQAPLPEVTQDLQPGRRGLA